MKIIIKIGKIIDGTGNPWIAMEIGVQGNKIVKMRRNIYSEGEITINALYNIN